MKILFFFLSVFLIYCHQFISIPQSVNTGTAGDQSDPDLVRISICQDVGELSSCANFSASTPQDLVSCHGDFTNTLSETLGEVKNSKTKFSFTDEEQSNFDSAVKNWEECTNEISTKIDTLDSEEKLQEVHEGILSCTEDFTSSASTIMECD